MILSENVFTESADDKETTVLRKPDGTFWGVSNGKMFQFDPETSGALQLEWEAWNAEQEPDIPEDDGGDDGVVLTGQNLDPLDTRELQQKYANKKKYEAQARLQRQQKRQWKHDQTMKHFTTSTSANEVEAALSDKINRFLNNLDSPDHPTKIWGKDDSRPDLINNLEPDKQYVPDRGKIKNPYPYLNKVNKPKPLIVFYFDRSGSFNSNDGENEEIQKKVDLGIRIVNMFKKAETDGKLECVVKYFSNRVYDDEADALKGCSTNLDDVVDDIDSISSGRIANIVVLTDSDADWVSKTTQVSGKVWLVYALTDAPKLKNHIKQSAGEPDEFFFKSM